MMIYILVVFVISMAICAFAAKKAEKIIYGDDTPNEALETIVGLVAMVPIINTFVACIILYYVVKFKFKEFKEKV
jgi:hypothetical protein